MPAAGPTVPLDATLYDALRQRAEAAGQSLAEAVDEAVRALLAEDAEDLQALDERRDEPTVAFDDLVADLRARGKL